MTMAHSFNVHKKPTLIWVGNFFVWFLIFSILIIYRDNNCKKAINDGLQVDMDQAIVIEEKLFGDCFETEDQKAGMGNFLEKDKEKKLKVVPFQNK